MNDLPNICLQGENGQGKADRQAKPLQFVKTEAKIPFQVETKKLTWGSLFQLTCLESRMSAKSF